MAPALLGPIGAPELLLILGVALLFFGGRLPDVARSLGRSFTQFKRGLRDVEDDLDKAQNDANRRIEEGSRPVQTTHREEEKSAQGSDS